MKVIHYPHPTLRHKSKPLQRVDDELAAMVREMFVLMYEHDGVGLAANQVDLPFRLFVVNLKSDPEEGEELVFLNPVISAPKGMAEGEEGCLSIPGLYGPVKRPKQVNITAYNLQGEEISATVTGLLARVVQHETDHLDGVLFPDRMSETSRADALPILEEFEINFESQRQTGGIPDDATIALRLAELERKYCG
ncbi:Peptide deformylase [Lignipirellula cremea]|uniref:Peptide deformylase n=1 Tax=Lignipirellula cremea TaxID=2528010 RepID=A0A518DVJ9_9BACT|nr:peptide deformylase [Lignipirellula cremea]QDU95859.1 Peptide deformylase [Lignipirellula cremea]